MRIVALRHKIGTKVFGAFFAMSLLVVGLGTYGYIVLRASGRIVADTYDYPMMAINFARAASVDFLQMSNGALRAQHAGPKDAVSLSKDIDALASTLSDDLDVAAERSTDSDERKVISKIRGLVRTWQAARHAGLAHGASADLSALNQKILDQFDMLIEFNADHGFIHRRQAISRIEGYESAVMVMTGVALLLAFGMTIFLARRIVNPLSAAARVADRVAAGAFDTPIPEGGRDETGALLNSMTVMQKNIAAQVAREQARAQSAEGRLLDAVESSREGIILAGADGIIAVANSEIAQLFPNFASEFEPGRSLSSALQHIESQSEKTDIDSRPLDKILLDTDSVIPAVTERRLPGGRWLRMSASRTSEGGAILFLSDFTDIKEREEKYRIAKLQAESASAAKTRFLANMSHELRTPLNAIIGFSEIISGEIFGPLGNARYLEYSQDVMRSGRHLLDIINNVLELARTEAGKVALKPEPTDLRYLLLDCVKMVREQCETAGLDLIVPPLDKEIVVPGEKAKLRQIFLNLLSNAVKFTDRGGEVELRLREDGDTVCVDIRDTGIGMSPEGVEIALTPFAQVDARLERRFEGTGLGLPLTKAFVELHGGTLRIVSEPGVGTTVTVSLSRTAPASAEPEIAAAS